MGTPPTSPSDKQGHSEEDEEWPSAGQLARAATRCASDWLSDTRTQWTPPRQHSIQTSGGCAWQQSFPSQRNSNFGDSGKSLSRTSSARNLASVADDSRKSAACGLVSQVPTSRRGSAPVAPAPGTNAHRSGGAHQHLTAGRKRVSAPRSVKGNQENIGPIINCTNPAFKPKPLPSNTKPASKPPSPRIASPQSLAEQRRSSIHAVEAKRTDGRHVDDNRQRGPQPVHNSTGSTNAKPKAPAARWRF